MVRIILCTKALANPLRQNSLSSVKISDECIREFEEFKLRGKYSYIMYKLDTQKLTITIDKTGAPGTSYDQVSLHLVSWDRRSNLTLKISVFGRFAQRRGQIRSDAHWLRVRRWRSTHQARVLVLDPARQHHAHQDVARIDSRSVQTSTQRHCYQCPRPRHVRCAIRRRKYWSDAKLRVPSLTVYFAARFEMPRKVPLNESHPLMYIESYSLVNTQLHIPVERNKSKYLGFEIVKRASFVYWNLGLNLTSNGNYDCCCSLVPLSCCCSLFRLSPSKQWISSTLALDSG